MISLLVIISLIAAAVFIGKKVWVGFHKAVGISHKPIDYVEDDTRRLSADYVPTLSYLNLADNKVALLPVIIRQQLERIDQEVATYQSWKEIDKQQTANLCENDFVLNKLISEHLPEMIDDFLHIQQARQSNPYSPPQQSATQDKALLTLQQCLADVEYRFNRVIEHYESQKLESLQTMQRYMKARD